jgi:isopenicillin N synthase-like dioxygenase
MSIVPIIDIAPAFSGSDQTRRAIARQIGDACENIGFFMVTGHGVPRGLVDEVDGLSRTFFDLPSEEKMQIEFQPRTRQRGYRFFGAANTAMAIKSGQKSQSSAVDPPPPDLRESLITGSEPVPGDPYFLKPGAQRFFQPNVWPERPGGMQGAYKAYFDACSRLSLTLMELSALALNLPATFFDDKFDRHITNLNAVHYPRQDVPPRPGQFRSGPHTDFGSLTVLASDGQPGLQVSVGGTWHDVTPVPESFIINVGDLMAQWTNDRWLSTLHRVVVPTQVTGASRSRLSLVFFHQPNFDAVVECLPTCLTPGELPKYAPVTSGDHLVAQLARVYAQKPAAA